MPIVISTGLLAGGNLPLQEHMVLGGGHVQYHQQCWKRWVMPIVTSTGLLVGRNLPLWEHVVLDGGRVRYPRQH